MEKTAMCKLARELREYVKVGQGAGAAGERRTSPVEWVTGNSMLDNSFGNEKLDWLRKYVAPRTIQRGLEAMNYLVSETAQSGLDRLTDFITPFAEHLSPNATAGRIVDRAKGLFSQAVAPMKNAFGHMDVNDVLNGYSDPMAQATGMAAGIQLPGFNQATAWRYPHGIEQALNNAGRQFRDQSTRGTNRILELLQGKGFDL